MPSCSLTGNRCRGRCRCGTQCHGAAHDRHRCCGPHHHRRVAAQRTDMGVADLREATTAIWYRLANRSQSFAREGVMKRGCLTSSAASCPASCSAEAHRSRCVLMSKRLAAFWIRPVMAPRVVANGLIPPRWQAISNSLQQPAFPTRRDSSEEGIECSRTDG